MFLWGGQSVPVAHPVQVLDETYHEHVRIGVRAQPVDPRLLGIPYIGHAHTGLPDGKVHRQHLAQGGLVVQRREPHYAGGIAQRENLVVRLPVVGREHHPHERQVQLVAQRDGAVLDAQVPDGHARGVQVDVGACRCRVVAVAQVPHEAPVQVGHAPRQQAEVVCQPEVVVQAVVPVGQGGKGIVVVHVVVRVAQVALEETLQREVAVRPPRHAHALPRDAELDAGVFLRGQVGVVHIGEAHAVHRGAGGEACLRCRSGLQQRYGPLFRVGAQGVPGRSFLLPRTGRQPRPLSCKGSFSTLFTLCLGSGRRCGLKTVSSVRSARRGCRFRFSRSPGPRFPVPLPVRAVRAARDGA